MGTCFGHFRRNEKKRKRLYRLECSHYNKEEDAVEAEEFNKTLHPKRSSFAQRIGSVLSMRRKNAGKPVQLEETETDDAWCDSKTNLYLNNGAVGELETTAEVQLVSLDVRSLAVPKTTTGVTPPWRKISLSSSTPPSSVDLEWEHEGVLESISNNIGCLSRRLASTATEDGSNGSGIEGSPAESLEWDPCETVLENDTEQLICEIERLTARALRETGGDWADR